MKKLISAVVLAIAGAWGGPVHADTVSVSSGPGTAVLTYQGQIDYNSPGTGVNNDLQGSIVTKTLTANAAQTMHYVYDNFDYTNNGNGIRLSEAVTTNLPVTKYVVQIANPSTFFTFADVPGQAVITFPAGDPLVTVVPPPAGASVVISGDKRSVTFTFAAPVSSFGVHIPLENLAALTGSPGSGSFDLVQTAVAVPLPNSAVGGIALLSLMGMAKFRRQRLISNV